MTAEDLDVALSFAQAAGTVRGDDDAAAFSNFAAGYADFTDDAETLATAWATGGALMSFGPISLDERLVQVHPADRGQLVTYPFPP